MNVSGMSLRDIVGKLKVATWSGVLDAFPRRFKEKTKRA